MKKILFKRSITCLAGIVGVYMTIIPLDISGQPASPSDIVKWQQQAKRVTIIRDTWGVPHVYGKTDADCVFGLAYAQAEDNMEQVEDNFIRAIGKGAAVHGEKSLIADQLVHAFEFVKISREEYEGASQTMRELYNAYAAGVNYYLHKHPEYKKTFLQKIEPWYPLAMIRYFYYVHDILPMIGVSNKDLQEQFKIDPEKNPTGSNAWAIGRAKTVNKSVMLYNGPHRPIFGNGTFTEVHVESETGWKFSGTTKFGFVVPYIGHNGNIGYGYTVNYPDLGDQYIETFDHPVDPLLYKYGTGYRKAVQWNDTIFLKMNDQIITKTVSFLKTHHGPVIKKINGKPVTVRLTNIERTGWYEQWYNMSKAANLSQFKKEVSVLAFPYFNMVYADKKGNIMYVNYQASAKRKDGFNWNKPVDGSDPETEWQGYHTFNELPQILNPASGFIQTCNSDMEYTSGVKSLDKKKFPTYMTGPEIHNPRSKQSLALLAQNEKIDFDRWAQITMDVKVQRADDSLAVFLSQINSEAALNPQLYNLVAPMVDVLKTWDHLASANSVGMTIFREMVHYSRSLHLPFLPALQKVKEKLETLYGTWQVPWGERMRLQKLDWARKESFSDDKPSYPLSGFNQNYGTIFCIEPEGVPILNDNRKKLYHVQGNSYTSIIELGKKVRAKSITCFGQQEAGPHAEDQAPLFANRQYKDAWFYKKDVLKHAERIYHPGE